MKPPSQMKRVSLLVYHDCSTGEDSGFSHDHCGKDCRYLFWRSEYGFSCELFSVSLTGIPADEKHRVRARRGAREESQCAVRSRKFTPYIRRRHARDRSESFREAIRLEWFGKDCYVMVQRGYPHLVMACARTRAELLKSSVGVCIEANRRKGSYGAHATRRDFRRFARRFRAMCLR